jgi:hypothetical protein
MHLDEVSPAGLPGCFVDIALIGKCRFRALPGHGPRIEYFPHGILETRD